MVIVIDDYGVSIERHNHSFRLMKDDHVRVVSPNKVTALHIIKTCHISTAAIVLAAECSIPILFFDAKGSVQARVWRSNFSGLPTVRYHQLLFARSPAGRQWVARCLTLKTEGQVAVLAYCRKRLSKDMPKVMEALKVLPEKNKQFMASEATDVTTLRSHEAGISRIYWQALAEAMEDHASFQKRTRRPAKDVFNTVLNYGYGILYSLVETATFTAGLDPQIGILHAAEYNRPALVYDAIEPFRPWVDRLVCDLIFRNEITPTHVDNRPEGGLWLNKEGKKILIPTFYAMMHQATRFNGKSIKRKDQIQHLLTALSKYLLEEFTPPDPYA